MDFTESNKQKSEAIAKAMKVLSSSDASWLAVDGVWLLLIGGKPVRCDECGRIREYERMAVAPRDVCPCESERAIASQHIKSLEAVVEWAMTVEVANTDSWMKGLMAQVNGLLIRNGDARRCTFDGQQLRLRNLHQCGKD